MYFITTKRMLEVCFSAHPNIQYRTVFSFNRKVLRRSNLPSIKKESHERDSFLIEGGVCLLFHGFVYNNQIKV